MEVVIDHGKDVRITKTFMAVQLYYKMEGTYVRGIRTVITVEEMKEQYEHLSKLNSEIKLRCESLKKE